MLDEQCSPRSRNGRLPVVILLVFCLAAVPAASVLAYEADQYSSRPVPIADSTEILNVAFNRELARLVEDWKHGRNERRFARAVYRRLGGRHWVDKMERWAIRSTAVEKLPRARPKGIYAGLPVWTTRIAALFGLAETLRLNGELIGSDKIGHFLSQGHKYFRRHLRTNNPQRVVALGLRNEGSIFGLVTTGVFSNADLVANYEGYLFYRSLFQDGVVPGKPTIVAWDGDRPYLQRPFDWADHVNEFWDEALNPSRYDRFLQKRIVRNLERLCPEYFSAPRLYVPRHYEALSARYAHLGLRDAVYNRLDQVCGAHG